MCAPIFWTLAEFCTQLDLNERRTAKVLAVVPSRKRGNRTEYDFRLGAAAIYAEKYGLDYRHICPHCLNPMQVGTPAEPITSE
jgi:hypothetical protein